MYLINRIIFLFLVTAIIHLPDVLGQEAEETSLINATLLENSSMTINGSSTLHDWEVEAGILPFFSKFPVIGSRRMRPGPVRMCVSSPLQFPLSSWMAVKTR